VRIDREVRCVEAASFEHNRLVALTLLVLGVAGCREGPQHAPPVAIPPTKAAPAADVVRTLPPTADRSPPANTDAKDSPQLAVARVRLAAREGNWDRLRSMMAQEFVWSFGGDADADQALEEWRRRPQHLEQLAKLLAGKCAPSADGQRLSCPPDPQGTGLRAGFELTQGRWLLSYFVAGD
jgi:hypothetical protein